MGPRRFPPSLPATRPIIRPRRPRRRPAPPPPPPKMWPFFPRHSFCISLCASCGRDEFASGARCRGVGSVLQTGPSPRCALRALPEEKTFIRATFVRDVWWCVGFRLPLCVHPFFFFLFFGALRVVAGLP